ncbi:unnamed protein product [Malus baccata var. baccata]
MTTAIVRTILSYKNYDDWKSQIKTYLLAEDLWDIIDEGTNECPKTEDEEKAQSKGWKKDAKALYAIQNSCGDDTYQLIKNETTAKQAWDTLSKRLEKPGGPSNEKEWRTPGAGHVNQETFVKYVNQDPQLGSAIVKWGGTALHYAIRKRCSVRIIQQLVDLMEKEHLVIPAAFGYTALYYLIRWFPERVGVAKCMAEKNPNLLTILPRQDKKALVAIAQAKTQGERMARYFYSLTQPETIKVVDAAHLISHGFRLQRFDIAWDLIQRYPKLAMNTDHDGNIPLAALASNRFAFKSGRPLNLWEKLIYIGIRIKPLPPLDKEKKHESDEGHLSDQKENQGHHLISSGINRIYQIKLMHELVQQFLDLMCKAMRKEDMRHVEYITHFCRSTYPVLEFTNEKNQSLLHIAAESRHYNVYNIICEFLRKQDKDDLDRSKYQSEGLKKKVRKLDKDVLEEIMKRKDNLGNNMLHTVARITPLSQIDHIQGATLQMQKEQQWFKVTIYLFIYAYIYEFFPYMLFIYILWL